jgi:phosphatidylglycerophosphate synthase
MGPLLGCFWIVVLLVLAWLDPFLAILCILSLSRETTLSYILSLSRETTLSVFEKSSLLMEFTLPSACL